ncbi:MAG: GIY-YIG nuclease family protein [Burkholderiales bacterium]|nr:GIY-YIG nuclease family protein [Burkholderiales bacterium]
MNDVGHLYVLANSAMPGLVKIGKTTRSPTERATELSGVTGLPTPFIVVYEQLFGDCSAAESFVHTYLATKGFRISDNREFFSAPVNDVVRAIALAPGALGNDVTVTDSALDPNLFESRQADDLDELQISIGSRPTPRQPWESVYEEADTNYFGIGSVIRDFKEAMRLFKQAAKLGSAPAYARIGLMHARGESVAASDSAALDYFKEGARKGSWYCYWAMGMLFFQPKTINRQGVDLANAEKCFALFLENWKGRVVDNSHSTQFELQSIDFGCQELMARKIQDSVSPPLALTGFFVERSVQLAVQSRKMAEDLKLAGVPNAAATYLAVADYFQSLKT